MGFVKARGSSFYYEEQGEGQPILLIPPSGSTASTWGALPGDLAEAGRVIAYDRRGYTRSGGEVVQSAAEHARDAAAILEALAARPTVLVGTSAGAIIALDLAVRRPDLVRAVVIPRGSLAGPAAPGRAGTGHAGQNAVAGVVGPLRTGSRNTAALGVLVSRRWQRLGRLPRTVAASCQGERENGGR